MMTTTQKNRPILLGLTAILLLCISSCKKDKITNKGGNDLQPVESAKLNSLKQQYGQQENLVLNTENWLNTLSPDWSKINVTVVNGSKVYEVSLKNPKRIFATTKVVDKNNAEQLVNSSLTKLLIFEDLKGKLKTCFMELIAFNHPEKLQQLSYKNYQDFDGIVNFYEMDGTLAKGWILTKGKVTAGTKTLAANGLSKGKGSGLQTQAMAPCGTMNVLKWREKCVSTTGIEGYGGSGYMACTWEQYSEMQTKYCDVPQDEEEGGYIPGPAGNGGDPDPNNILESDIRYATVVENGQPKIQDIKKYTNCFNDGKIAQSYTMTIFVDQPVPGQRDAFKVIMPTGGVVTNPYGVPTGIVFQTIDGKNFDVGHTFVTFEKNNTDGTNVRQTLGFYPSDSPIASAGAMEDNSGHGADVWYTMTVSAAQFNAAIQKVESDFANKRYVLHNLNSKEYNCTDAAISWMNAAGANFANSSSGGLFKNTPGSFGQVLKDKPGAVANPTTGITGKGPCN